ncbi:hypothetical protein B0T26DRAFT_729685 [Lasiosphaeria miniovina]|uniref:Uncharacterized protein n=1 Tax=Lasiosphaeria miniovina TaxID=1954250 RepID=A0AA39ZSY9_9PEZI|nr:uncharacterized protein B0T26DRAFT_729685 [Lasiosphaeria miniovina]KAK0703048.1 hypothetical protein B0T26DRAFT_729685 [Lasiosphaeria miniovina]
MYTPDGTSLSFPNPLLLEPSSSSTITEMGEIPIPSIEDAVDGDDVKPAPQKDTEAFSNAPDSRYVEFIPNYSSTSVLGRRLTHFFNGLAETRRVRAAAKGESKGEGKALERRARVAAAAKGKGKAQAFSPDAPATLASLANSFGPEQWGQQGNADSSNMRPSPPSPEAVMTHFSEPFDFGSYLGASAVVVGGGENNNNNEPSTMLPPRDSYPDVLGSGSHNAFAAAGTAVSFTWDAGLPYIEDSVWFAPSNRRDDVVTQASAPLPATASPTPPSSGGVGVGSQAPVPVAAPAPPPDTTVSFTWDPELSYIEDSVWFAPSRRGDDLVTKTTAPLPAASPTPPSDGSVSTQAPAPVEYIDPAADTPRMQPADSWSTRIASSLLKVAA